MVCFPERVVRFNKKKHKKTLWITVGILKSINRRNKLCKSLKKTQLNSISYATQKSTFNQYRNRLGKTIALAKRMYYKTIFEHYKQDMEKTWAILSDILHRKAVTSLPDTMTVEGHDCGDRRLLQKSLIFFRRCCRAEWAY